MPSERDDQRFVVTTADFLDSIGPENLTEDYREENERGDERIGTAFDSKPRALAVVPSCTR